MSVIERHSRSVKVKSELDGSVWIAATSGGQFRFYQDESYEGGTFASNDINALTSIAKVLAEAVSDNVRFSIGKDGK